MPRECVVHPASELSSLRPNLGPRFRGAARLGSEWLGGRRRHAGPAL